MEKTKVLELFKNECVKAGGQAAWASANGVSGAYVSDVLSGRRDPGEKILGALGIERVVTYRRKKRDD